jgi:predicted secreted hydrolase
MRWRRFVVCSLALVSLMGLSPGAVDNELWRLARPDYAWSFPQDHWARPGYKTEWWYFTGHLQAADGHRFGYQFTFFRIGVLPAQPELDSDWAARNIIMGHAAIGDLDRPGHYFSEVLYRAAPLLGGFGTYPDPQIAWSRGPAGTERNWRLMWNGAAFDFSMHDAAQGFGLTLSTRPSKRLIFQGPNGFSRKSGAPHKGSQYYSFTRLETSGQVTLGERTWAVTGQSWMDKEFGSNQLAEDQVGWDWFSLQLDDQREIMLYIVRGQNRAGDFAQGTVVQPDGRTVYLDGDDFRITVQRHWKSLETSGRYPSTWIISIPQERLEMTVVPKIADQENRSRLLPTLHYWEGAVDLLAQGRPIGKGYVELTGYGDASRPAL